MFTIYGASDDLVEIEGPGGDEVGCYNKRVIVTIHAPDKSSGVHVTMAYVDPCVWQATVAQLDEDIPIPPCRVTSRGYTAVVEIDAPDGATVSWEVVP